MVEHATSPSSEKEVKVKVENKSTLTPPASEEADKNDDSGSELSDLEPEVEDNGEIVPDHYYGGGKIPVFKPVRLVSPFYRYPFTQLSLLADP